MDDDAEFADYVGGRWRRLVATAYFLTGDFQEAEDLVQTTLIKVHARWGRIRRDDIDAYVRRSLINVVNSRGHITYGAVYTLPGDPGWQVWTAQGPKIVLPADDRTITGYDAAGGVVFQVSM